MEQIRIELNHEQARYLLHVVSDVYADKAMEHEDHFQGHDPLRDTNIYALHETCRQLRTQLSKPTEL